MDGAPYGPKQNSTNLCSDNSAQSPGTNFLRTSVLNRILTRNTFLFLIICQTDSGWVLFSDAASSFHLISITTWHVLNTTRISLAYYEERNSAQDNFFRTATVPIAVQLTCSPHHTFPDSDTTALDCWVVSRHPGGHDPTPAVRQTPNAT